MRIRIGVIVAEDKDGFHAIVPGLEDCTVSAADLATLRALLQDAIEGQLDGLPPATFRFRGLQPLPARSSHAARWWRRACDLGRRLLLVPGRRVPADRGRA